MKVIYPLHSECMLFSYLWGKKEIKCFIFRITVVFMTVHGEPLPLPGMWPLHWYWSHYRAGPEQKWWLEKKSLMWTNLCPLVRRREVNCSLNNPENHHQPNAENYNHLNLWKCLIFCLYCWQLTSIPNPVSRPARTPARATVSRNETNILETRI